MIRAALFDIDGTLCPSHALCIDPATAEVLQALRDKGVKLGLATGRNLPETLPLEKDFAFDGISVCNGALIYAGRPGERELVEAHPLDAEGVAAVADLVADDKLATLVEYFDRSCVCGSPERIAGVAERTVGKSCYEPERFVDPSRRVYKFGFVMEDVDEAALDCVPNLVRVKNDALICDVIGEDGGKERSTPALAKAWGVRPSEVACFGDGGNDLQFLGGEGVGVAMGGSREAAVQAADMAVEGYYGAGIREAFERLGFEF